MATIPSNKINDKDKCEEINYPLSQEISNLICSVSLSDLQAMVLWGVPVVVIASGKRKVEIAKAAIKSGYINVFIIDDDLAQALIDQA